MNNTKTLAAIAAIFIAATLVVGGTFAAITGTQSALAYQKKKGGDEKNGNTVTIQKCKQDETASGFDNTGEQECGNTICTHPGDNASCVSESEGAAAAAGSTSTSSSTSGIPRVSPLACSNIIINPVPGSTNTQTVTCTITGPINIPPGTAVSPTAVTMRSSDAACNNGASGTLHAPDGTTFDVCVSTRA
jgi:hypothetical protein